MGSQKLMVTIFFCFTVLSMRAQREAADYDRRWRVVDSLLKVAGLPESALAEVGRIDALAVQEHNSGQEIKALIYRVTIQQGKNEKEDTAVIRSIENRIVGAVQPERSILESLLARLYWSYLQQNRYKLYNRTATVTHSGNDITTWTVDDFHRRIGELFVTSVKEEGLLQRTGLNEWDPILIKGNSRQLRPTLYDILAHESLGYFGSPEATIDQPEDGYEIDDPAVFADASVFSAHVFSGMDTSSPHYQALLLYQRLLRFHLADPKPGALNDADIERLGFADQYSIAPDKDSMYMLGLTRLTGPWGDDPAVAQAWYLQAQKYHDGAGADRMLRAKAICERVLGESDSSEGQMNCRILLEDIVRPNLDLQAEQFNVPGKPFRCLVKWSNLKRIYIRLVKIDSSMWKKEQAQDNDYWPDWLQAPAFRSLSQDLPDSGDFLIHTVEIPIGSLPPGSYALLTSADQDFDIRKGVILGQRIYISTIAWLAGGRDYFVVDRESGQPLNDIRIQVWKRHYNNQDTKWQVSRGEAYHTDQQGHFRLNEHKVPDQYLFEFQRPGEDLYLADQRGRVYYNGESGQMATDNKVQYENKNSRVCFFLDRSIYRPGQTVYFKGISVTRDYDTRRLKPVAGRKGEVTLLNANREKIDSIELTTDEFGAYHGVFRLPEHSLNGQFEILDPLGQSSVGSFRVEEYKRPRFAVSFDRLKDSYRAGDSIRVKGTAIAYAGNSLDGATVKYRVTRSARYPAYRSYDRRPFIHSRLQEIAHGMLKTDANGQFQVIFDALPDRNVPVASDPRFEYQVEAEVTDISGENQSGTTTIVAGYTVVDLSIGLEEGATMRADSLRAIRVDVTNLSSEPVQAMVHVAAYPLLAPNRLIRERLWVTAPDRWVMPESAFLDSFPHDQYREELNKETWPRGAAAWEGVDSTGGQALAVQLKPGWWMIEATTTDSSGHVAKDLRYVELYDNQTSGPVSPEYLWATGPEPSAPVEPGQEVQVVTGSSAKDIFLFRRVERPYSVLPDSYQPEGSDGEDTLKYSFLTTNSGRRVDTWPITEADRGGFGIADAFVKDNRFYVHQTVVEVPWDNKDLKVSYTSFRDKTEPGSAEKWGVNISGWRGSRATAQVLASMYDASLDQFVPHYWSAPYLYPSIGEVSTWQNIDDFSAYWSNSQGRPVRELTRRFKMYDRLMTFSSGGYFQHDINPDIRLRVRGLVPDIPGAVPEVEYKTDVVGENLVLAKSELQSKFLGVDDEEAKADVGAAPAAPPVQVRTNFQETAFFYPDLRTDSSGSVSFSFTMPESLTRWKWMTLAHTRDLAFGYSEKTIVTQKQLMVQPNMPRFLREGDKINLSVKVVNLTDSEMTGQMGLSLSDPTTGETTDGIFLNRQPNQYFTVPARGSFGVEFPLEIPYQYNRPVSYRIVAEAGAFSDGEEAILPVVSNRMLVTETLPLNMPGDGVRSFTFGKLLRSGSSETLSNHALTVEFTANPAWYAVQALPYLMEYPFECAEQTFDRLYANAVASKIVSGSARIAQVFERWRTVDTAALLSNLEKNQELKSVLLEETPWVLEGKTETQQKRRISLLFDMVRMSRELESTIDRLRELQASDGGFPWFKGGPDDRYVTQYILTGLGRMQRMEVLPPGLSEKVKSIVIAALGFADRQIKADYDQDLKAASGVHSISPFAAQYLYMRSLFNDVGIPGGSFAAVNFYRKLAQQEWVKSGKYIQGMVALALFRTGDVATAQSILASLRETAIRNEELGMYWKGMEGGYYWYQAPVELSALMIEAFREIGHDMVADRELKTWLLRQKQTHNWSTTKATTDAVYALLMGGTDWLDQQREVRVQLGDKVVEMAGEAGTGYDKIIFDAPFIDTSMGNIKVSLKSARGSGAPERGGSPAWGAVYWQYFDQLDRIMPAEGGGGAGAVKAPLRVEKRLFIQRNTDRGPVLDTVPDNGTLHIGDRVVVRIVLRSDRDFEYVHLKDMRGACLEPLNVLSGYKWQGGLGYYETTKDVSTEFFFSRVPRGVHVFEYPLVVEQTGEYSNGVASVECMYAPEFAFHTEGIRINVEGGQ
jgi:Bacterial Alpha-2-macroglobulin MG10 domain/Alpha-2-macroglobulin family/MG2 domain